MTPTDHSQNNTSPPSKKRQHAQKKLTRPTPLVKKTTHNPKITHRPSGSRSSLESGGEEEDEPPMASSFQQFCATCDKQIIVPNASVLYCSARCRRQDSQSQSLPLFKTDVSPPPSPHSSSQFDNLPIRDIVPQRSPTNYTPVSPSTMSGYPSVSGSTLSGQISDRTLRRSSAPRTDSEAARYLARFGSLDTARPRYTRSSTNMIGDSTPSLSHTPNSLASAIVPYTPQQYSASSASSQRALPPRMPNPRWSSTSFSSRSIDLVTPISHASSYITITGEPPSKAEGINQHAIDLTQPYKSDTEGSLSYEKRSSLEASMSPARGSLKQLFRFEEMRSQPVTNWVVPEPTLQPRRDS